MDIGDVVFERYRVVGEVGRGGMATVWRATDERFDSDVALKRVSFANIEDPERWRARTLDEARNVRRLGHHPEVITVHDVVSTDDDVWLVLEYLPSVDLGRLLGRQGALPPIRVAEIGAAVARALDGAHALQMIHRDVKPGNILVCDDGRVKLADFGISVVQGGAHYTRTGYLVGSVAWSSPEWARGDPLSTRSDIFSLGATLFHALHGEPPFGLDANGNALLLRVASGNRNEVTAVDGPLRGLIELMLQIEPIRRPDARYVAEELQRIADLPRQPTRDAPPDASAGPGPGRSGTRVEGVDGGAGGPVPPPGPHRRGRVPALLRAPLRTWPRRVATAVVVLLAALGLAALLLPATDLTRMPATADRIALATDQTSVDPCSLTDPDSLSRFGPVRTEPGHTLATCNTRIGAPGGEARNNVSLYTVDRISRFSGKNRQQIGPLTVIRNGITSEGCSTTILLPDQTYVVVQSDNYTDRSRSIDACQVTEAATAVAVNKLAARGTTVAADPQRAEDYPLYRARACEVPPVGSLAAVPGLNVDAVLPGFGNWTCTWGNQNYGRPVAQIAFDRFRPDALPTLGTPTATASGTVYVRQSAGTYNRTQCAAYAQVRPPRSSSLPAEVVFAYTDTPQPAEDQCRQAAGLALASKAALQR